jgi:hypothetical protein
MVADILDIDVKTGISDSGQIKLGFIDTDLDVTEQFVVDNNLTDDLVDVELGYSEIAKADFVALTPSKIKKIITPENPNDIEVILGDARRFISSTDTIFNRLASNRLNIASPPFSKTDALLVVDDTTGFVDPANLPAELDWITPMVLVSGTEIMNYTTLTAVQFTTSGRGTTNHGSTKPAEHDDEAECSQAFGANRDLDYSNGGWLRFLLSVLLTRKSSGQTAGHSLYDLSNHDTDFYGFGLGLTSTEVDIDSFENMDCFVCPDTKELTNDNYGRGWIVHKQENARRWIADFLKQLRCFFYISGDGKLAVGTYDYLWIDRVKSSEGTIDNDTIINGRMDIQYDEVVNIVEMSWDKNHLTGATEQKNKYSCDESIAAYDRAEKELILSTDFFHKDAVEADIKKWMAGYFLTYANPPVGFTIQTTVDNIKYLPGDVCAITYDRFKDLRAAAPTQGWTARSALITGQKIVWTGHTTPVIEIKGFSWEPLHKFDLATDIGMVKKTQADMDDATCAFAGTADANLEAADAYIDYSDSTDVFVFEIEIDASGSGGAGERHFHFSFFIQTTGPVANVHVFRYDNLRVLSGEAAFTRFFKFSNDWGTQLTHDRIKVDVWGFDDWENTGGLSNYPTVTVKNIWMFDLSNVTLSTE